MEPSAFPEQGKNTYFLFFLSLAFSQSSPKGNQVSCCTGETVSLNPARRAFRRTHLQHWVSLSLHCVSPRELTKQNPRRLPNTKKWLKTEPTNYHRKRPSTQASGVSRFCSQSSHTGACRSARGWTPRPREACDLGSTLAG